MRRATEGVMVAAALAGLAALLFLPFTVALLALIGLVAAVVLFDALRHRFLSQMAWRNFKRRPGLSALLILGLMVSSSIISASFIVNDTLENMVRTQASESFGGVDLALGEPGGGYLAEEELLDLAAAVRGVEGVRAAVPLIVDTTPVEADSGLSRPSVRLLGVSEDAVDQFGELTDVSGERVDTQPPAGSLYINEDLSDELDVGEGDVLTLILANRTVELTVDRVLRPEGLAGYQGGSVLLVRLNEYQQFAGREGQLNHLLVALDGSDAQRLDASARVRGEIEDLAAEDGPSGVEVVVDRKERIDSDLDYLGMFISLFFVFGSFSVIAGIVLLINLFTLAGEDRKTELGIMRAIGMHRGHLAKVLTYEGTAYAGIAAGVGAAAGVALSYAIIWFLGESRVLGDAQLLPYFTFTPQSIALAYLIGFLITLLTVYLTATRIARLNIVSAIRNLPETMTAPRAHLVRGLALEGVIGGAILILLGIMGEDLALANSGFSLAALALGALLAPRAGPTLAWTAAGLLCLVVWVPLPFGYRIFPYEASSEAFIPAGVFMVIAGVILVMAHGDAIIALFTRALRFRGSYQAVLRTSISYPLKARFRTALSIFIFALVIFTVTTVSIVSSTVGTNVEISIEEALGGFDIVGYPSARSPFGSDPRDELTSDTLLRSENVSDMLSCSLANLAMHRPKTNQSALYQAVGVPADFNQRGDYPLSDWDDEYATEDEVWGALQERDDVVIADGRLAIRENEISYGDIPFRELQVGERLLFTGPDGQPREVTVIGVMKQSVLPGVFMGEEQVRQSFQAEGYGLIIVRLAEGLDPGEQTGLLERQYLPHGLVTIDLNALAEEVTRSANSMFGLSRVVLSLGLIIGIAGLGVITVRSIGERKWEIGIMRAIGYRKGMVVANFALESFLISVLGVVIGTVMGIIIGYQLWAVSLRDAYDYIFVFDGWSVLAIDLLALALTLAAVYPAARRAAVVQPAEVLRSE